MSAEVYLDNAATTFPKPPSVIKAVKSCISNYCANPGRSTHRLAMRSAEAVYETREEIANFIGLPSPERVVFTANATHALNLAIKGLINDRCHVITSDMEHNSVIRPLHALTRKIGIEVSVYDSSLPLTEAIPPLIREDTKYIVTSLASNVTGRAVDVTELSAIARKYSLTTIADASQYVGHVKLDLAKTPLDIVCAPGHKSLFGIQGSGFMAVCCSKTLGTLMEGGSGSESFSPDMPAYLPERLEAGTLNVPSIVSLGAGIRYIKKLGIDYVEEKIGLLTVRLENALDMPKIRLFGCDNGIASFLLEGSSSEKVAAELAEVGISVRSGLHCSPSMHRKLGTERFGLVRASLSVLNEKRDIDKLYRRLVKM